jgi:hypothetical protein
MPKLDIKAMDEAAIYAIDRKFSTRPRCCDWCDRRGLLSRPLARLYIKSDRLKAGSPEPYYWWVHQACGVMILEDETISEYLWL